MPQCYKGHADKNKHESSLTHHKAYYPRKAQATTCLTVKGKSTRHLILNLNVTIHVDGNAILQGCAREVPGLVYGIVSKGCLCIQVSHALVYTFRHKEDPMH